MDSPAPPLLVSQNDDVVCVKVKGRATVKTSVPLKALMEERRAKGIIHFILALEECLVMDSTFLGVLANQAFELVEDGDPKGSIQLLNPNERLLGLLDNLGVLDLFNVVHQEAQPDQPSYEAMRTSLDSGTKTEMTETSLNAHRALIALNPANEDKFKDVTRFLEEELNRQKEND
ncbi:MAG: STAS domain-containing protein [Verrucomicrobia bacterium]|jgi:anti-sigma B factor antagonist|nr:STAS domain-containing protein [Verrucomicrobiota bacterium]